MTATSTKKPKPQKFKKKALSEFVDWILSRHAQHGGVTEVRLLATKPIKAAWSGYFDPEHAEDLIDAIEPLPGGPRDKIPFGKHPVIGEANVYFTMQPVNPALLARSAYAFSQCPATSDQDIAAYSLFAVDVDPDRPAGISSTDEEKAAALEVAEKVAAWFDERGIKTAWADSGNGYHLLIPTTLYADVPAASAKAQALLKLLDAKFSNDKAKLDTLIYNPSRIFKLYGTKAVKGSDIPDRPHRYANMKVSDLPDDIDLFAKLEGDLDAHQAAEQKPPAALKTSTNGQAAKKASPAVQPSENAWDAQTSAEVLRGVLELSGLEFREKDKPSGLMFEFKDCPHHTDSDGHTYECCVIVRPDGKYAAKCQHDSEATWKEFKALIGWDEHAKGVMAELGISKPNPYRATPNGLVHVVQTKKDVTVVPLTNFTARILSDVGEDDGVEVRHTFEVEAKVGQKTVRFSVPAQQFLMMNWPIEHLGAQAVVYAGQGCKDHARAAIQLLSTDVKSVVTFAHSGWREHDGKRIYLHAGGAIGGQADENEVAPGVRVSLPEPLARYKLPEPNMGSQLIRAVRRAMRLLKVAPHRISVPLFAAVWRAVLRPADFAEFLVGPSGAGKSEHAALHQQFWGAAMDARHLPANWSSTANTNEALAFHAKDALLVVDDFAPAGGQFDVQKQHRDADRLLRGQGNSSGRGRMRADATLRPAKPPRGLILATGEDVPRGISLRARMLVLEVSPQDIDWDRLTTCQADARDGTYALAMSGYLCWLADRYEEVLEAMPARVEALRAEAAASGQHKRTPSIVAELYFGLEVFAKFAAAVGAFSEKRAKEFLASGWAALGEAAAAQGAVQAGSDPVDRFLELLNAALASGKAHVAGPDGKRPDSPAAWGWRDGPEGWWACGDRVGWVDSKALYLEPEVAVKAAKDMAQDDPLTVGSKTLHKRLHERGLLTQVDEKRHRLTARKTLENKVREVLHLSPKTVSPPQGAAPPD